MRKFQLVVCDIDSTLVTTDRRLTPKAKEVIERLHRHGIKFGLASGRSVDQQLIHQAKNWGFDFDFDLLIGMNGSELYDSIHHQRHDYFKLKGETIKEIIELMEPFDLNPFMYYKNTMLCKRWDELTRKSSERNSTDVMIAEDISQMYAEDNAKIMFRVPEEKMPEIEAYVAQHQSDKFKAFKTQTTMIEFSDPRISKAVALEKFCEFNQIPLDEVIAFGDMSNDIEMLKISGLGVCLLNGSDDTKAIADEITEYTCDEDGFAHYMEEHFLNELGW